MILENNKLLSVELRALLFDRKLRFKERGGGRLLKLLFHFETGSRIRFKSRPLGSKFKII